MESQMRKSTFESRLVALALLLAGPASAQSMLDAQANYDPVIRDRSTIGTIDQNTGFGERTDLNSGTTNFFVTVAALPGNNGLEVALRYKYVRGRSLLYPAWHWERDDPYLSGDFPKAEGWVLGSDTPASQARSTARCSWADGYRNPPIVPDDDHRNGGLYYPSEYFNGIRMVLPRGGGGALNPLDATPPVPPPAQGGPYKWATNEGWFFSCIPLRNGPGEGFLALAPDGTKYYFDDYAPGPELDPLDKRNPAGSDITLSRQEFRIYASRIEDRFGNYVEGLGASDGRSITTTDLGGGVLRVDAGTREWTVSTAGAFTITNPDGSQWKMTSDWSNLSWADTSAHTDPGPFCMAVEPLSQYAGAATVTVTIPSGASAKFDFQPVLRGVSWAPLACASAEGANGPYLVNPDLLTEISLVKKTVSGPGLATSWTQMTYGQPNGCYAPGNQSGTCTASSPTTIATKVSRSDGTYATYTFGNRSFVNQGQLLTIEEGVGTNAPLKVVNQAWQLFDAIGNAYYGLSSPASALGTIKRMAVTQRNTAEQGRTFAWSIASNCGSGADLCVDALARPTKVVKSSTSTP